MAHTFNFVAGNLQKIRRVPKYLWGALRSRFSRRDPMLWVVGSAFGVADGALAFARAASMLDPTPKIVWLCADTAEMQAAAAAGFDAELRDSSDGAKLTRWAGLLAVTHGFGDVNRYNVSGAMIVQLWHGQPMKKLHADSPAATNLGILGRIPGSHALMRRAYRNATSKIALFPVTSAVFAPFIRSAFHLEDAVRVLGEPRGDVLFSGTAIERRQHAHEIIAARLGELNATRLFLYAPTWRDGDPDPAIPTAAEWKLIDATMTELDALLIIRPHPLSVGNYAEHGERVRLLPPALQPEVMPLLAGIDALITDYSSILFDYVATSQPYVLLAPDLEEYRAKRGLYLDYESFGEHQQSWKDTLQQLWLLFNNSDAYEAARQLSDHLSARFHTHTDGKSAQRTALTARMLLAKHFRRYFSV